MLQHSFFPHNNSSGLVRMLVIDRCAVLSGFPSRILLAITSAIQLVPFQLTLIDSGTSYRYAEAFG